MFSKLRARTAVPSVARLPLRIQSQAQHGLAQNIQRVRFRQRRIRPRAVIGFVCMSLLCYNAFDKTVFATLEKAADELDKNLDEDTRKQLEEEEEGSFFIPFPGTTQQIVPRPYKATDPEWKEYVKFSKNPEQGKAVRLDLANLVKGVCEKHPLLKMRCGKNMKLRRFWLDIDFPPVPPPEYERSGLEIGDDFIAWTTMPVDADTVFKLRQALWPSAFGQSFWSFSKTLLNQNANALGEYFGVQPAPQVSFESILAKHAKRPVITSGKGDESSGTTGTPRTFSESSAGKTIPESPTAAAGQTEGESKDSFQVGIMKSMQMHTRNAFAAFTVTFLKNWKNARSYPPRGAILVSGLVELDAPGAWLVVDVKAAWDPKTKSFDSKTMHLAIRRMQMKKQAPLGGFN